mmetsp:Transcript_5148/g.18573  ORF Transcript_5148/g.18573 Transcript_5148/m.18573 type:complete len:376 (+) Transcript_5148:89-1216(+)
MVGTLCEEKAEPLTEVWAGADHEENDRPRAPSQGNPSRSPASLSSYSLRDKSGRQVVPCDCCGGLVSVPASLPESGESSFPCEHCSFPIIVREGHRFLLGLRLLNELSFAEVAEAQAKVVGGAAYRTFKAVEVAALEEKLRSAFRPAAPASRAEAGAKRKRRQKRKRQGGLPEEPEGARERDEAANRYLRAKWELAVLSKGGAPGPLERLERPSSGHLQERLDFLAMLYERDRSWPGFWEVRREAHEAVEAIRGGAIEFLSERRRIGSVRESAAAMAEVVSCLREDLEAVGEGGEDGPGLQVLESIAERHAASESSKFASMASGHLKLMETVRLEAARIVDNLSPEASEPARVFPSKAYDLLRDLHGALHRALRL